MLGLLLVPVYIAALWVVGGVLWAQAAGAWTSGVLPACLVAGVVGVAMLALPKRRRH